MASVTIEGQTIHLDLPVTVPELTLAVTVPPVRGVQANDLCLSPVSTRSALRTGTYLSGRECTLVAFDATQRTMTVRVSA